MEAGEASGTASLAATVKINYIIVRNAKYRAGVLAELLFTNLLSFKLLPTAYMDDFAILWQRKRYPFVF